MRGFSLAFVMSGWLMVQGVAMAQGKDPSAPVDLARQGKWVVSSADGACHLVNVFGQGDQQVILQLTQFGPRDGFEVEMIGKSMVNFIHARSMAMGLDQATPVEGRFLDGQTKLSDGRSMPTLMMQGRSIGATRAQAEAALAAAQSLTIRTPSHGWIRLKLDGMSGPVAAMRQCTAGLVADWGYDPAQIAQMPRPIGSPLAWLKPGDFTQRGVFLSLREQIHVRLDVDKDGAVAACHVQMASQPDFYGDKVCALVKARARFEPARDAQGQAVAAYYLEAVQVRTSSRLTFD